MVQQSPKLPSEVLSVAATSLSRRRDNSKHPLKFSSSTSTALLPCLAQGQGFGQAWQGRITKSRPPPDLPHLRSGAMSGQAADIGYEQSRLPARCEAQLALNAAPRIPPRITRPRLALMMRQYLHQEPVPLGDKIVNKSLESATIVSSPQGASQSNGPHRPLFLL
jgi:hypothetical protein